VFKKHVDVALQGLVGMVVVGGWFNSMILEIFSSLWFYDSKAEQSWLPQPVLTGQVLPSLNHPIKL